MGAPKWKEGRPAGRPSSYRHEASLVDNQVAEVGEGRGNSDAARADVNKSLSPVKRCGHPAVRLNPHHPPVRPVSDTAHDRTR